MSQKKRRTKGKVKVQSGTESASSVRPRVGKAGRNPKRAAVVASPSSSLRLLLVYGCVLISGGAALIYEVVWARKLAQFMGMTGYAHIAVLTAFMAGLALGSYLLGQRADRIANPLRAYAILELGIGTYALTTLFWFDWAEAAYIAAAPIVGVSGFAAHGFRFVLALIMLLIPTFLMGGTLPLLVRGLSGQVAELSKLTSQLYGLNTLGATLGAFLGGYVFLPGLGMAGTIWVSAGLALLAAGGVFALGSGGDTGLVHPVENGGASDPEQNTSRPDQPSAGGRWLLVGFALSGFAAMIYQLVWIRALTLVIGGSVYAFSTTLTTFLAGIALGSFAANRFAGAYSGERFMKMAGWLQAGIAISATAGLWLITCLPDLFLKGYNSGLSESFNLYLGFVFLLCFGVMFLPTFLMGAVFPLVATAWTKQAAGVGRGIGTAYAANSVGTILGTLLGGLFILPHLGIHGSTFFAAGASLVAGGLFWMRRTVPSGRQSALAFTGVAAALVILGILVPKWDKTVMTSGVFYHTNWFNETDNWHDAVRTRDLKYYAEGVDAVVCVTESEGNRVLHINGKPDGSNQEDLSTQILLVQIPMLLHPEPRQVAVIGLGTGTTPAGAAAHEKLQSLDVIEISEEVVAASNYFRDINHDVLDDPRTKLNVADARNFLHASKTRYDVIVSEPSNPWISGVANLFTREFFALAKSRLTDDGIMSQWIHCYNMGEEDLRGIIRTYQSVFASVTLWMPTRGDLILIGSDKPYHLDFSRVSGALGEKRIGSMLEVIGRGTFENIASSFFLGNDDLKSYAGDAPLNTDDRPRLEFSAPRYLYSQTTDKNLTGIVNFLAGRSVLPPVSGMVRSEQGGLLLPSIRMLIRPGQASIEKVNAALAVSRQIDSNGAINLGTQHLLQWSEGDDLISFAASRHTQVWTAEDRNLILAASMTGGVVDQGEVQLPNGPLANWVAGTGTDPRYRTIGLAWSVGAEGDDSRDCISLRQYLNSSLPDAAPPSELARQFGGQFSTSQ